MSGRKPAPRRPRKAPSPPEWSDAAILRQRLKDTQAAYATLVASLPARDKAIVARIYATLPARDQRAAQQGADIAVKQLADQGLLRQTPASTGVRKVVERNAAGQIVAIVERAEQIEPEAS